MKGQLPLLYDLLLALGSAAQEQHNTENCFHLVLNVVETGRWILTVNMGAESARQREIQFGAQSQKSKHGPEPANALLMA